MYNGRVIVYWYRYNIYQTTFSTRGKKPYSIFGYSVMETEQEDGYGLNYTGGPIAFDTTDAIGPPV